MKITEKTEKTEIDEDNMYSSGIKNLAKNKIKGKV